MLKRLRYSTATIEFHVVRVIGRLVGIGFVVRYLRNPNPAATVRVLRAFGATVGEGAKVKGALLVDNASEDKDSTGDLRNLRLGNNCYIGDSVYVDLASIVEIGTSAMLSGRVAIVSHADCGRSPWLAARFHRIASPVRVGDGAWVGFGAIIMAGSVIGEQSVVAAGAVVRSAIPPRTLWAGVPARLVRSLS